MVVLETGSPVGRPQQGLQGTCKIDESVAHQEEHGQQGGEDVDISQEDSALADGHGEDEGSCWLTTAGRGGERGQEWYDAIFGDGLQKSRSTGERLETSTEG